MADRHSSQCQ